MFHSVKSVHLFSYNRNSHIHVNTVSKMQQFYSIFRCVLLLINTDGYVWYSLHIYWIATYLSRDTYTIWFCIAYKCGYVGTVQYTHWMYEHSYAKLNNRFVIYSMACTMIWFLCFCFRIKLWLKWQQCFSVHYTPREIQHKNCDWEAFG